MGLETHPHRHRDPRPPPPLQTRRKGIRTCRNQPILPVVRHFEEEATALAIGRYIFI